MVFDHQTEHSSQWATITSMASKIGCNPETLRSWVRQAERDEGKRPGLTTDEGERIKALEREVREPSSGERDLTESLSFFRGGGARPPVQEVIGLMEAHMREFGVEPVCRILQIAPSTWYEHARRKADPGRVR